MTIGSRATGCSGDTLRTRDTGGSCHACRPGGTRQALGALDAEREASTTGRAALREPRFPDQAHDARSTVVAGREHPVGAESRHRDIYEPRYREHARRE